MNEARRICLFSETDPNISQKQLIQKLACEFKIRIPASTIKKELYIFGIAISALKTCLYVTKC
ncbi:hypothetical protein BpHYR1_004194 [Brachionus plicatilis]|uniref:Uncharacterized protein n=1 Tax=Brachionus plicatilis TaxID=10195 RepID=A0A3M7Q2W3_BRAPC|nr:hypothetical protein BpHYR1_004194 [Brachionus plicatilis]